MVAVCPILHLHSSVGLADFRLRAIGSNEPYFDPRNGDHFLERAHRVFGPLTNKLTSSITKHHDRFRLSLGFSGSFLESCEKYSPTLLDSLQNLLTFSSCDLLSSPKHYGLASLISEEEFTWQAQNHTEHLQKTFHKKPKVFYNTELIYSDYIGKMVANLGFNGCVFEGWPTILPQNCSSGHLFCHHDYHNLSLLPSCTSLTTDLTSYLLKDSCCSLPVNTERFMTWIDREARNGSEIVVIFFKLDAAKPNAAAFVDFYCDLLDELAINSKHKCVTATEALAQYQPIKPLSVTRPTSSAPGSHDLIMWLGDELQHDILHLLSSIEKDVKETSSNELITQWRKLLAIENLENLQVKFFNSEEEMLSHNYTKLSPYDSYLRIKNILEDLQLKIAQSLKPTLPNFDQFIGNNLPIKEDVFSHPNN